MVGGGRGRRVAPAHTHIKAGRAGPGGRGVCFKNALLTFHSEKPFTRAEPLHYTRLFYDCAVCLFELEFFGRLLTF